MLISQASNTEIDYISDGAKISSLIWRASQDQTIAVHVVEKKAHFCVLVILQVHFSTSTHSRRVLGPQASTHAAHRPWEFFHVLLSLFFTLRTRVMESLYQNSMVFLPLPYLYLFFLKYHHRFFTIELFIVQGLEGHL